MRSPPSGGVRRKTGRTHASARSVSAEPVHGTNATDCHLGRPAGSPDGRTGGQGRGEGSHPNWLVGPRSSRCQIVPRTCPGQRDCTVTATGRVTGTGPKRGIARRAFGHDGRCEVEREANASRSTSGGWFVPLGCPGQRSGSGRSAPGAVRFSFRYTTRGCVPSQMGRPSAGTRAAGDRPAQPDRSPSGGSGRRASAPHDSYTTSSLRNLWLRSEITPPVRTTPCTGAPRRGRRGRRPRRSPSSSGRGTGSSGRRPS